MAPCDQAPDQLGNTYCLPLGVWGGRSLAQIWTGVPSQWGKCEGGELSLATPGAWAPDQLVNTSHRPLGAWGGWLQVQIWPGVPP